MEITILMLVLITFISGVVGGIVVAESMDTYENHRARSRQQRRAKRQARREKNRKNVNFTIDKFYCVIDCGRVVNPDTVEAQMESGIIFGLSAALYGQITFADGEVEQYNFPQYDMVRMNVAPQVEVHIMDNDEYPGGVGEPSTPPAAPALTNAIFAATGQRIRSLPLQKHGFGFG